MHFYFTELLPPRQAFFPAFCRIQLPLLVEELVHKHTLQLGDTLLLRHLTVQFVNLLVDVNSSIASRQKCGNAYYNEYSQLSHISFSQFILHASTN